MGGEPIDNLKKAMGLLLDPDAAAVNLLQPSARDVTWIVPFSSNPYEPIRVVGNDPAALKVALQKVQALDAGGGTDLYSALDVALKLIQPYDADGTLADFLPAIVAMTDGASSTDAKPQLLADINSLPYGHDVPIHAISFGDADEDQLKEISSLTIGRLFSSGGDLAKALQSAKGYN
jgi:Ca-activated chloride channel homolog